MEMHPFNLPWCGFLLAMVGIGVALHLLLRHRSDLTQQRSLVTLAGASVVLYTTYTFNSILDPSIPEVVFWQNLPFHLCNLVAWALIPAYLLNWKWLRAFCFFPGALAGLLTLTSPVPVYIGHPLFSLPSIGFYGVHSMNVVLGILLATLGFYRPNWKDAILTVGYLGLLALLIFPLDVIMRAWVDPGTNYFYLFDPEDADILVAVHSLVPIPLIYTMLLLPVALAGTLLQAGVYLGATHLKEHWRRPTVLMETDGADQVSRSEFGPCE